jgi:hypothetical protein
LSDYNETTAALLVVLLGTGVVASALSILWTAAMDRAWPDKDTILGLTKIFMGMAVAFMLIALIYRYVLT